jgi:pyruvate,water dikinase
MTGRDPLHTYGGSDAFWTTVNVSEAIPGVPTPMNWSIFSLGGNVSVPRAYHNLGILPRSELGETATDRRLTGIFHGRVAINVTRFREIADLTPGTSGSAMERQLLGSVRDGIPDRTSWRSRCSSRWRSARRLPVVAVRFPWQAARLPGLARRLHAAQFRWWADTTGSRWVSSVTALRTAVARFDRAMTAHLMGVAVSQACFEQLTRLAAGDGSLVARLTSGYGGFEEAGMIDELWRVARGDSTPAGFVGRYGFHGPDEGEISAPSWREDPRLVVTLAQRYAARGREDSAADRARRRTEREDAERHLLAALPPAGRVRAGAVLRAARRYLPLREVGKASFLMAVDVARFAARLRGAELTTAGVLDSADDIFGFTIEEVLAGLPADARALAAERAATRRRYQGLVLPDRWQGTPTPVPRSDTDQPARAAAGDRLTGVSVTNGVVEATVRVATSLHAAEELEPDEILVCEVTDPSWCTVFPLVAGLIVDVGGPLSHAAIVARELGIPCVINTGDAARRLRTGMSVRLDATDGVIEVR